MNSKELIVLINRWSKAVAELVNSSFNVSSAVATHGTILGDARENFIRDILQRFLPANIVVGTGQVIDSDDKISKQIDLIIYRNDFPILRTFGSSDVYLIEGVIATIEIKSKINTKALIEALENCKSVRDLKPTFIRQSLNEYSKSTYGVNDYDLLEVTQQNSIMSLILPPTYIFSYKGFTGNSLSEFINSINEWYMNVKGGECDVTIMPEVIVSEGCVALKNLDDALGLGFVPDDILLADTKKNTLMNFDHELKMDSDNIKDSIGMKPGEELFYGLAAKADESPLQYLICNLLEIICVRQGVQKFGDTQVKYSLEKYIADPKCNAGWTGTAINLNRIIAL